MTKSFKSLVTIVLGTAVLAVGYFGVYSYWTNLSESRALLAVSETENARLKQATSDIQTFLNQYNTNLSEAEKANRALPMDDADVPVLLDYYSRQVTDSGLNLIDLTMQQSNDGNVEVAEHTIQSVDWQVQASGSYEAFQDYLLRVKQGLRLTDILGVNLDLADAEGADGRTLRYGVTLRTYYQK